MSKRTPYEVKRAILRVLREKPLSYTKLQTKLSTNYDSVKNNCEELQMYDFVNISKGERHAKNGKPFYDVELTPKGRELAQKMGKSKP